MELLQLKYFCHAAATQNFSQTAKEFQVPQSNISQSIKRLEDELESTFFTRKGNRVLLNEDGRVFYQDVSEALQLIEQARNTALGISAPPKLRIGILFSRHYVMEAVKKFMVLFPQVELITAKFGDRSNMDDFDLIIADHTLKHPQFTAECLLHDRIVLITPKNLLSPGSHASVDEMREQSYIILHKTTRTANICNALGFSPRITLQCENSTSLLQCVSLGLGVALVPYLTWRWNFAGNSLDIKEVGDFFRDTCLYRKKSRRANPYADTFCELLREEYRTLTEEVS